MPKHSFYPDPIFAGVGSSEGWTPQLQIQQKEYVPEAGQDTLPGIDWEADDNPYKSRFNTYRSEADRRATTYAEQQKLLDGLKSDDDEARRAAAMQLGFDFVDDEVSDAPDEIAELRARLDKADQRDRERDERDQQARLAQAVDSQITEMGLDEEDGDWVLARAIALQPLENGMPDLNSAYEQLQARDKAMHEKWRTSKRTPAISRGQTGSEQKALADMTDTERIEYVMAQHEVD